VNEHAESRIGEPTNRIGYGGLDEHFGMAPLV
jgi:hypothetical protein